MKTGGSLLFVAAILCGTQAARSEIQEIDILVAYTPRALANHDAYFRGRGVDRSLRESLNFSMVNMNHVHQNSGTDARYRLVHLMENPVAFDEATIGGDPSGETDDTPHRHTLNHLVSKDDGVMDEVHALRDQYGADMVVLVVEGDYWSTWTGGNANVLSANDPAQSEHAPFYMVDWSSIDSTAWPHENGHAMGLHHDWYRSSHKLGRLPTTHSFGYVSQDCTWRTLMAYADHCEDLIGIRCPRLPLFSSPDRLHFEGLAMGVPAGTGLDCINRNLDNPPCDADAVASLNLTAPTVKAFRGETVPRLAAPEDLQPSADVSTGPATLSWSEVPGATEYEVLVGVTKDNPDQDAFVWEWLHDQDVLYFSHTVASTACSSQRCSLDLDLRPGYHYFSVKAHDESGYSRWTDPQAFVVEAPETDGAHVVEQIAPIGTYYSPGAEVVLTFEPLPYQTEAYKVVVRDRDDAYTIHSQKYPTHSTCADGLCTVRLPSQGWAAHRYKWKVRADDTPYGDGDYSPYARFYIR